MVNKPKAILAGPFIGELFWEIFRFAPIVLYKKFIEYKNEADLIVWTRPDRFDIYGNASNILVPLRLDENNYTQDCYSMTGFSESEYNNLSKLIRFNFEERYDIIEHIYPNISNRNYCNKFQFYNKKCSYEYFPRLENKKIVDETISPDKKIIVLAPRYRKGLSRNWDKWQEFYDLLSETDLVNKFQFVICGKEPDYIKDEKNRFLDINYFPKNEDVSLIGYTIEIIKKSILTVGSQSGIPNISLLLKVPVLEWGHEKKFHTIDYNVFNTPVDFIEDYNYSLEPKIIIEKMEKILGRIK